MKSTAGQVVSSVVFMPLYEMRTDVLNRVLSNLEGAYTALLTHGYTHDELMPIVRMMNECRKESENRYCGVK